MAHPTRFERVAFAFGGRGSIQLSYGCLLLTQCLREILARVKRGTSVSQVLVFQSSFRSRFHKNWLDTCLRRAAVNLRRRPRKRLAVEGQTRRAKVWRLPQAEKRRASGLRAALYRHHLLGIEPVVDPISPMLHQLRA
jgi:hypothetical protein